MGSVEPAENASLFQAGELLAGKYRVLRLIGRGGMAEVYAATHEVLQQTVAIKVLLRDVAVNQGASARFLNEARAAARIRGEHVAAVTDVGALDDGSAYMVLEYLEGEDLEDYATRIGPLAASEAVDFVLQSLQALAQAHALGFVHRDIKPSNLFLSKRPDGSAIVKVLDFGISKAPRLSETPDGHATSTRAVLGSPYYMAPEQARSARSVDPRADVWAIGVTLYRLLTGELPFGGETLTELLLSIVEATPPAPRSLRPDLPEALEASVLRCLRKDREERFANVAELAQALRPFAGSEGPSVDRISRTIGGKSGVPVPVAVPATTTAAVVPPAAVATQASAGAESTAVPSSGGAHAPTIPAPPPSAPLVGTVASAGVGTHASWAESSSDVPVIPRRSPVWLLASAGGLVVVGILVLAVRSTHTAASPTTPSATEAPARPLEQAAAAPPPPAAPLTASGSPAPAVQPPATLEAPPPARVLSAPAVHGAVGRPAAVSAATSKAATPSVSARPVAVPPPPAAAPPAAQPAPAPAPAPAPQEPYDVLNQRN